MTHTMLVEQYIHLTQTVLPDISHKRNWPIHNDHCFQRVVLDTVCQCCWYEKIPTPAYQHLTYQQALAAVKLCEQIKNNEVNLNVLNDTSKRYRRKQQSFNF
jgi:hypothetical protein